MSRFHAQRFICDGLIVIIILLRSIIYNGQKGKNLYITDGNTPDSTNGHKNDGKIWT